MPEDSPRQPGNVGPILSGKFEGPVAVDGGDAIDFRGALNPMYKPTLLQPIPLPPYIPEPWPAEDVLPTPGALPPGSRLPHSRNALFTGREAQLRTLAHAFVPSTTSQAAGERVLIIQAIQGLGGVGKTQLAVEFAYRYGRCFHGVHWLNALQPDRFSEEVAACGRAMGIEPWPETLPEQHALTLATWAAGGPRLIILDNLEDPDSARDWLAQLVQASCHILLTARRTEWPPDIGLNPLRVDCFTPEESCALLLGHFAGKRIDTDTDLNALHARLGGLPLAIELAGRYLAHIPRLSIPAYLRQLADALAHPSMQGWRTAEGNPTRHDLNLAATFRVSWARLDDVSAREIFALAGYCAPNTPIPCEMLERAAGLDSEACDLALSELRTLGLLEEGNAIHPLLAEFARWVMRRETIGGEPSGQQDNAYLDMERMTRLVDALKALTYEADDTGVPAAFAQLRPHVEALAPLAEKAGMEIASAALWNNLGYYLLTLADLDRAQVALERALGILEKTLPPKKPQIATTVNNIGLVLRSQGDFPRARAAFERALLIDEAVHGMMHQAVARDLSNLGLVLQDSDDFSGARAAFENALHIHMEIYGSRNKHVADDLNNLGGLLHRIGNLTDAQEAFSGCLEILEQILEPKHPHIAVVVSNLGCVLEDLGDLLGAQKAHERALLISREAYKLEHPEVAIRLNNLGNVFLKSGDLHQAKSAFELALSIDRAAYGQKHPAVARDMSNLGTTLHALDDLLGARSLLESAIHILDLAVGSEHTQIADGLNNLGAVLQDLDDFSSARDAYERALQILEKTLPAEHHDIAITTNNLGSVLYALGDLRAARAAFERALRIDEAVFGPDHPAVAAIVNNLGGVLRDLGDLAGARAACERALRIWEAVYGPDHPQVATGVNNLGNVLQDLGDLAAARAAFERALAIREKVFGRDHPDSATTLWWLGILERDGGNREQAYAYLEEALRIFEHFLPPEHPDILATRENLESLT